MTIEPRIAAILCLATLTLPGCDLADRIEGKSPGREHVTRLAAVTLPEPEPEPPAPTPAPVMPVCRFSDAGFLICT